MDGLTMKDAMVLKDGNSMGSRDSNISPNYFDFPYAVIFYLNI